MPILTRPSIDFKNPDYDRIIRQRLDVLARIRANPKDTPYIVADMKAIYKEYPAQMIVDWGVTVDPRNVARGLPAMMPFILFDKQVEFIDEILDCWKKREGLTAEKSRDMGFSWCAMSLSSVLCLQYDDMAIGTGSRKAELVDDLGNVDALLPKARIFLKFLPPEFRDGWDERKHSKEMQITFPKTRSIIDGEAGDAIGRGGRKGIYFVDEACHLVNPISVDMSLSSNTDCRVEMSSVKGMDNPFAQRRHSGKHRVFTAGWRTDPRKDQAWYDAYLEKWGPTVTAQEVDMNYSASVDGVIIPSLWAQAAVDAHVKLGIQVTGKRFGALDIADLGIDKNAFAGRHGILLEHIEEWPGEDAGDPHGTTARAFRLTEEWRLESGFAYDADGMGPAVRGAARVLNAERQKVGARLIRVVPHRGSASGEALYQPNAFAKGEDGKALDRKNKDYFANYKAQSYIALRWRFLQTYRAVVKGMPYDPEDIISISSKLPKLEQVLMELSQPVRKETPTGKILVDKQPDGMKSPNLADAVNMVYAPRRLDMNISDNLLEHA